MEDPQLTLLVVMFVGGFGLIVNGYYKSSLRRVILGILLILISF
jgi:hypothetical protein